MPILKTRSGQLFCKSTFAIQESDLLFSMCSSVPSPRRSLVHTDSPGKFYRLFLSPGSTTLQKTRILSGILIWMSILKQEVSLLGKRKCSCKNNRKDLQNSVCQLRTQNRWHQFVQELITKLPALDRTFFLEKKSSIFKAGRTQMISILQKL